MTPPPAILPHHRRAWFCRVFQWYSRRLLTKQFNAVRVASAHARAMEGLSDPGGPTMLLFNHQSWWDPIITAALARAYAPSTHVYAPMDRAMVRRFAFMRQLGIFGVDLDDPRAFKALVQYMADLARNDPRAGFWITPQGRFADVRAPLELRPGAAAIASRLARGGTPPGVVCMAVEFAFWEDRKPEVLLLPVPCPPPPRHTTSLWHRQISHTLHGAMDELARLTIARDPGAFTIILGRGASGVNPAYDTILRLTGRQPAITSHRPRPEASR